MRKLVEGAENWLMGNEKVVDCGKSVLNCKQKKRFFVFNNLLHKNKPSDALITEFPFAAELISYNQEGDNNKFSCIQNNEIEN
jgi:hypothetical protein